MDGWAITARDPSQFEDGRVLLGHAGRIRLVHLLGREHFPADPDHLVGERDHCDLVVTARLDLPQSFAERGVVPFQVQE